MTTFAAPRPAGAGRLNLGDVRREALLTARKRVLIVALGFVMVALVALTRIAWLGVVQPAPVRMSLATALLPDRGEITDRNGVPLARSFPAYELRFNVAAMGEGEAPLVKPAGQVADELLRIFPDLDRSVVLAKLEGGNSDVLRRGVVPEDANKVMALGELALEFPLVDGRYYPEGPLAAHVLGNVDIEGRGRIGMEEVLDARLRDPVHAGEAAALSIDVRVQGALEDELERGMLAVNARGAAGIVLDVDTGEVLAMASLPDFDPNFIRREDQIRTPDMVEHEQMAAVVNRVTAQAYELGSVFKPLTVAAAIDSGVVTDLSRRYGASEGIRVGRFEIGDDHAMGPDLNVAQSLIHSSNIVTAQIATEVGGDTLKKYFADLGLGEAPYIELPSRQRPISFEGTWPEDKVMTVSFGHGVAVTPLNLASAYAAMVNGGIWRPATLMRLEPGTAPRGRRVFKESTSARMNQLMRMIAVYGTGRSADAPGFRIGGKTGSAEKVGPRGYDRTRLVSSFAAAFPMDRPRYVVIALLDEPRGTVASSYQRTAAWNAAPIVGRLVPRIGPLLGVLPDADRDIDLTDVAQLVGNMEDVE